jgi:hypothetical protein
MDEAFVRAVQRRTAQRRLGYPPFSESRIAYVLTTGANWSGPIGYFRVVVVKGRTDNLISFCANGVTKTGPTTFELVEENFLPDRDLEILLLVPMDG